MNKGFIMPKIYILCGFSFSGKTTWANRSGLKAFHYDKMKYFDYRGDRKIADFMEDEIRKYNHDCVLDHTNFCEKSMKSLCERYKDWDITLVIFDISFEQLLRNRENSDRHVRKKFPNLVPRFAKFREEVEKVKKLPYCKIILTDSYYR